MKSFFCPICSTYYKTSKLKSEIIEDETPSYKESKIKFFCPNHDQHFRLIREKEFKAIPLEKKKAFMDLFKTGKCLGDCAKEVGLTSDMAGEILVRQIKPIGNYLDFEVKQ